MSSVITTKSGQIRGEPMFKQNKKVRASSASKSTSKPAARSAKGKSVKRVYFFGPGKTEGKADQKELLGGKGANLADMTAAGLPVPPGFTISTETCREYNDARGKPPAGGLGEGENDLAMTEKSRGNKFGAGK